MANEPRRPTAPRSLQDAALGRLSEMVSQIRPEARNGLREGWDTLVNIVLAPCNGAGGVGGVPRSEVDDLVRCQQGGDDWTAPRRTPCQGGGNSNSNSSGQRHEWAASVPFEVSASSSSTELSGKANDRARASTASTPAVPLPPRTAPVAIPRPITPRDARTQRSRALLRQLGAQHQLASGFHGESLAGTAHPITPVEDEGEGRAALAAAPPSSPASPGAASQGQQEASFDYDDGISAISSHTLEEMERRRLARERTQSSNVVRVSALDYSQIIDEDTELRFQETTGTIETTRVLGTIDGDGAGAAMADEDARRGAFGDPFFDPREFARVPSSRTQNTSLSEDSDAFEARWKQDEARYWTAGSQGDDAEGAAARRRDRASGRRAERPSVEERARRLRELSRSRSRSDGSGVSLERSLTRPDIPLLRY